MDGNSQRDFGQSLPNLNRADGVPRGCNPGGGNIIGYHNIARNDNFDVSKCSQNLLYLGISYKFRDSEPVTAGGHRGFLLKSIKICNFQT